MSESNAFAKSKYDKIIQLKNETVNFFDKNPDLF